MINVVMLSTKDFAGSGINFCRAVQRVSDINIRLVTKLENKYGYDTDYCMQFCSRPFMQKIIYNADIIHFKGDELPSLRWNDICLPNVPIVFTAGGSGFRRAKVNRMIGKQWFKIEDYIQVTDWRTTLTPDLNYPELGGEYLPQCMDMGSAPYTWEPRERIFILHSPSARRKKGTEEYIIPAISILKHRGFNIEFRIVENMNNKELIELKKTASIFIDQVCDTGFYGMNTIEAIQFGIPVVNYISDQAINQSNGLLNDLPIINVQMNADDVADKIEAAIPHLKEISVKTKTFAERVHSYEVAGNILKQNYTRLYENNISRIKHAHDMPYRPYVNNNDGYVRVRILNHKLGIVNDYSYYPENIATALCRSKMCVLE